jgi:hypothetical protein
MERQEEVEVELPPFPVEVMAGQLPPFPALPMVLPPAWPGSENCVKDEHKLFK